MDREISVITLTQDNIILLNKWGEKILDLKENVKKNTEKDKEEN